MSKTSRRRGKLSEEELEEVQNFVYKKNAEEDKFLKSMSVNIKCKNENQKLVIESIKNNERSTSLQMKYDDINEKIYSISSHAENNTAYLEEISALSDKIIYLLDTFGDSIQNLSQMSDNISDELIQIKSN